MDESIRQKLQPGVRVKVTQQIAGPDYGWATEIVGSVVSYDQQPTGSWYAHSKDDRLWLDRLTLRKADGEMITLSLDNYSAVEFLGESATLAAK
jgi:hypothetical protein